MLVFYRPRHPKKMFYQRLTLPIHELENKRQLKCTFMSIDQKEEKEVTLYPNKGSRVEQMLEEAKQVSSRNAILETIPDAVQNFRQKLLGGLNDTWMVFY